MSSFNTFHDLGSLNSIELHEPKLIGGTTRETATAVIMTALDGERVLVLREGWQQHAAVIQSLCPGFDANKDHPLNTPIEVDWWAVTGTTTMVIRGSGPNGQGTTNLLA